MKKRMIFACLIAVLFIGQLAMPALVKADASGDMNNDGLINQNDVQILVLQVAGQETPDVENGDLDGDGIIAPTDVALLKHEVAYQIPNQNPDPVPPAQTPGDANGDGQVDYMDLGVMKEIVAGQVPSDGSADLDGDGIISPSDVAAIMLLLAQQSGGSSTSSMSAPALLTEDTSLTPEISVDQIANTSTETAPIYTLPSNPLCQGITGDLNGDGLINELDFTVMRSMIAGLEPSSPCADFDQDGIVAPSDFASIRHLVLAEIPQNNIIQTPAPLVTSENASGDCTYGDANGDNQIDYKDTDLVKEMVAGVIPSTTSGDLDGDGIVSPSDIALLKLKIAQQNGSNAVTPVEEGNCAVAPIETIRPAGSINVGSFPVCEAVNYSDWSAPVDNISTREVVSKTPYDCELSEAQKSDMTKTVTVEAQVLGEKIYADGTLLRAVNQVEIYVIENGFKRHIKTLKELAAKYFGQTIYNVSPEVLDQYPTIQ